MQLDEIIFFRQFLCTSCASCKSNKIFDFEVAKYKFDKERDKIDLNVLTINNTVSFELLR